MKRGTRSGRGAAAQGTPPPRNAAAPEPVAATAPKAKRGRKAKAPLKGKVAEPADQLTVAEQKRQLLAVAEFARELARSDCGARDAAAALSVEARCRNKLIDLLRGDDQAAEIQDLKAQVAAMNAHLAGKKGSAQRADVAPAPRVARRPESLQ